MNNFTEWIHTAKGTELLRYNPANKAEADAIAAEIDSRLDRNVPAILDNIFSFLSNITEDEEDDDE